MWEGDAINARFLSYIRHETSSCLSLTLVAELNVDEPHTE